MRKYNNIESTIKDKVAHIWLNRPEKHNALNEEMIFEIMDLLNDLKKDSLKLLFLKGRGPSFCAGADLDWFANFELNSKEIASLLSNCLLEIYNFPAPVISFVHGNIFGGGNGLMCASDIIYAEKDSIFAFPEVHKGLAPAIISPFVLNRMSIGKAKYYMFNGNKFGIKEAQESGLIDFIFSKENIEEESLAIIENFKEISKNALKETKNLLNKIRPDSIHTESIKKTISSFSHMRDGNDYKEFVKSIEEKRKPNWQN